MSPYFPQSKDTAYWCPNCRAYFVRSNMRCLVNHSPGSCCHEYETMVGSPHRPTTEQNETMTKEGS